MHFGVAKAAAACAFVGVIAFSSAVSGQEARSGANAPSRSSDPAINKLAWELGTSMAVAIADKLLGSDADQPRFRQSWTAAEERASRLGVELERLPVRAGSLTENLTAMIRYHNKARQTIATRLLDRHGMQACRLYGLGASVGLLSRTYRMNIVKLDHQLATVILDDGEHSGLPEDIWRPVGDLLSKGAPRDDVRAKLRELDTKINAYFKEANGAVPTSEQSIPSSSTPAK